MMRGGAAWTQKDNVQLTISLNQNFPPADYETHRVAKFEAIQVVNLNDGARGS